MTSDKNPSGLPVTERGEWLATSRGGMWSLDHPEAGDVFIEDIILGMSRTCRYGGQIMRSALFYSVAEHSQLMCNWALDNDQVNYLEDALAIVLHDAAEAYFGDMPTPIKRRLPDFAQMEDRAQAVILEAFGLTKENTKITKAVIKSIDTRIRSDERQTMIREPARSAGHELIWERDNLPPQQALGVKIQCMSSDVAAKSFEVFLRKLAQYLPARDASVREALERQLDMMEFEISLDPDAISAEPCREMDEVWGP